MELTYHGHSAFQIDHDETTILLDPWISENPHCEKAADEFTEIDVVLVTHGADDHLGDAPTIARRNDADLVCDFATYLSLSDSGFPTDKLVGHIWGPAVEMGGWTLRIVEARHQSVRIDDGIIGPALAYIVEIDGQRIYHMGDTSIFSDIRLFGELYEPTVSLVPVGRAAGYYAELPPDEAALVAEWLESEVTVPMHYLPGSENPAAFERRCHERGVDETSDVRLMEPGETLSL